MTGFRLAILLSLASACHAAQFQVGAILQLGGQGNSDWEIGAGTSASSPSATADDNPYWASGVAQQFDIFYSQPANAITVELFRSGSASLFNSVSYTSSGAAPAANATWLISAASFFVQALAGPAGLTSVTVSNLALSGLNGAINVINPISQTTLQATHTAGGAASTVTQSQDIVFQGDSTGSWRLSGFMTLTGLLGPPAGNQLAFGVTASTTPEPAPALLSLLGLSLGFAYRQWRKQSVNRGGAAG